MRVDFRDVEDLHAELRKEKIERGDPDVANVLVVDHVKEHLLDHGRKIRKFDD